MRANLQKIVFLIHSAGGEIYRVGGGVRDSVLGLPVKDEDLLVRLLAPKHVVSLLDSLGARVDVVGASFGVIKATLDGETFDIALPRRERSFGQGHRDFEVVTDSQLPLEEDLSRRDFTINAMAQNLVTNEIVDPFYGRHDLRQKLIRAVGNPVNRFEEDPLRILRAIRFVSKLDFDVEPKTSNAMRRAAETLRTVAPERVQTELCGLLMGKAPAFALRKAQWLGILSQIIPEFHASNGFQQHNDHHDKTVDEHVFTAVQHAADRGYSLNVRLALLLHDIAKPQTFTVDEAGRGHFYKHDDVGADLTRGILNELRFSSDVSHAVTKLVREHLRPGDMPQKRELRKFVANLGDLYLEALQVRLCDRLAHSPNVARGALHSFDASLEAIKDLAADVVGFNEDQLALRGNEIEAHFNIKGKYIGETKRHLANAVIEGLVANERHALLDYMYQAIGKVEAIGRALYPRGFK